MAMPRQAGPRRARLRRCCATATAVNRASADLAVDFAGQGSPPPNSLVAYRYDQSWPILMGAGNDRFRGASQVASCRCDDRGGPGRDSLSVGGSGYILPTAARGLTAW